METITIIASVFTLNAAMGWYLHADIGRLDRRVDRLEDRVDKLDDRVYALATSMKPLIEEANERNRAKGQ